MYETHWLERTDRERRWLRRYARSDEECPDRGTHGYHGALVAIEDGPAELSQRAGDDRPYHYSPDPGDEAFSRDPRWLEVAHCSCGYTFTKLDPFQVHTEIIYRRLDTGEDTTISDAAVGALWDAWWMGEWAQGDDGLSIVCKLPGNHHWVIENRASNCTRPDEPHHCWVRHGSFGDRLTVDKQGNTCSAGGGSVWVNQGRAEEWHGFLRNGQLLEVGET